MIVLTILTLMVVIHTVRLKKRETNLTWCPSLITCVKREVTSCERISWIDLQSQPNVTMMWVRDPFQSLSFTRFKVQSNEFWEEEGGNRKGLLGRKRQKGIRHTNINSRLEYYAHDRSTVVLFSWRRKMRDSSSATLFTALKIAHSRGI